LELPLFPLLYNLYYMLHLCVSHATLNDDDDDDDDNNNNNNDNNNNNKVSCHRPFLPGNSLEPTVIPTAQASSFTLQYFRIVCDVSSMAVFCSVSIECFPGTASKIFLKLLVHETPQHFLHLLLAPSNSFVQFISIFFPDSDVRWTLRWSILSFLGMVTILFSAVRGPLLIIINSGKITLRA